MTRGGVVHPRTEEAMRPILWRRCNGTRPHLVEAFGTPIRVTENKGVGGKRPR
jgi:hypothetical protein